MPAPASVGVSGTGSTGLRTGDIVNSQEATRPADSDLCALVLGGGEPPGWSDERIADVLARWDRALDALTGALEVEYYGPDVGLGAGRAVYRMVVRRHRLGACVDSWGLWICTALPHARWRPAWRLGQVGRLRRREVIKRLPAFFDGYAGAVRQAGKDGTKAGRRILELAHRLRVAVDARDPGRQ